MILRKGWGTPRFVKNLEASRCGQRTKSWPKHWDKQCQTLKTVHIRHFCYSEHFWVSVGGGRAPRFGRIIEGGFRFGTLPLQTWFPVVSNILIAPHKNLPHTVLWSRQVLFTMNPNLGISSHFLLLCVYHLTPATNNTNLVYEIILHNSSLYTLKYDFNETDTKSVLVKSRPHDCLLSGQITSYT